jgi:hypothetical protein
VRLQDVRVVRVEDGRLDRRAEDGLGVVDQEGVERVVPGHEDREGRLSRTARAARLLPQ